MKYKILCIKFAKPDYVHFILSVDRDCATYNIRPEGQRVFSVYFKRSHKSRDLKSFRKLHLFQCSALWILVLQCQSSRAVFFPPLWNIRFNSKPNSFNFHELSRCHTFYISYAPTAVVFYDPVRICDTNLFAKLSGRRCTHITRTRIYNSNCRAFRPKTGARTITKVAFKIP